MLCIIIGIIIGVILIRLSLLIHQKDLSKCIFELGILGILVGIGLGMFLQTKLTENILIYETEIVSLKNSVSSERSNIFVSVSAENIYSYRYEVETDIGTGTSTEYKLETISGNVIESEDPNCKVPVYRKYKQKAKVTWWSFGLGYEKITHVFYVPEGTISRNVNLD